MVYKAHDFDVSAGYRELGEAPAVVANAVVPARVVAEREVGAVDVQPPEALRRAEERRVLDESRSMVNELAAFVRADFNSLVDVKHSL